MKVKRVQAGESRTKLRRIARDLEDLGDLRDFNAAIERNAGKPGIQGEQAKKQLGL